MFKTPSFEIIMGKQLEPRNFGREVKTSPLNVVNAKIGDTRFKSTGFRFGFFVIPPDTSQYVRELGPKPRIRGFGIERLFIGDPRCPADFLALLIFPSFDQSTDRCEAILLTISLAGSSLGSWGTSLPWTASWRMDWRRWAGPEGWSSRTSK